MANIDPYLQAKLELNSKLRKLQAALEIPPGLKIARIRMVGKNDDFVEVAGVSQNGEIIAKIGTVRFRNIRLVTQYDY